MRAGPFKQIQKDMREHSKFFLGKNKVMGVAMGKIPEDEHADNSHLLTKYLHGQVCLMFTNLKKKQIEASFKEAEVEDFATAGLPASYTVHLEKGVKSLDGFGHSMEPHLRTLGLPTKLNFQKIELLSDVYVCREGQILNVEQTKILKLLGHKMGTF
jgi:mRNA turnover protein 4